MGWLKTFGKIVLFASLAGLGALVVAVLIAMASLPGFDELKSSPNGQMVRVRAADGSVIVSLGPSYGDWLPSQDIPETMKKAMVAVEDRRFYMHPGIDPIGMGRSVWVAWERKGTGRRLQGASTITQQLARNIFLTNAYSFGRKFREVILALAMERKFSKEQILELYLNRVYFGGGAYGIDAASRKFFDHSAKTINLPEAAIIAGLVKAPSHYSPTADREAAIDRAKVVLDVMLDAGAITAREAQETDLSKVSLAAEGDQNAVRYFTDWALAQLDDLVDEQVQPIDVWTTIDPAMQRAADAAIRANAPDGAQGALVALDRDGAVRAMVGGKDYVSSIYNRADPGRTPAGIGVQAVRLYRGDGSRGETRYRGNRRARRYRRVEPAQQQPQICRRDRRPHRLRLFDQHRRGQARSARSVSIRSPIWRIASASDRRSTPIRRWCSARRTSA